jgi:hypothetical protein
MGVIAELMRFVVPANMTGLPAISLPVGYSQTGLPIGMQLMGRPWEGHLLHHRVNADGGVHANECSALEAAHKMMEVIADRQ